jgi:phage tail-like protein
MVSQISGTRVSMYREYLPALFQEDVDELGVNFLGRFLLAFEQVLSGLGDETDPGIEEIIEGVPDPGNPGNQLLGGIHRYFEPGPDLPEHLRAPGEFLDWLASWVALSLRQDWTEAEKRRFISRIVPLYRLRGTKAGLVEALRAYTGLAQVTVTEHPDIPHFFEVEMDLRVETDALGDIADLLRRKQQIAKAIIDQEKPAHTYYNLTTRIPTTLQIGITSTIGVDTLLGTPA